MSRIGYGITSSAVGTALIALALSGVIIAGFVGQPPEISVQLQGLYPRGQTGFIAVQVLNRYLARNLTVYSVSISVARSNPIELLASPTQISGMRAQALILPFGVPWQLAVGSQDYVITVLYARSQFFTFGAEFETTFLSGMITVT